MLFPVILCILWTLKFSNYPTADNFFPFPICFPLKVKISSNTSLYKPPPMDTYKLTANPHCVWYQRRTSNSKPAATNLKTHPSWNCGRWWPIWTAGKFSSCAVPKRTQRAISLHSSTLGRKKKIITALSVITCNLVYNVAFMRASFTSNFCRYLAQEVPSLVSQCTTITLLSHSPLCIVRLISCNDLAACCHVWV